LDFPCFATCVPRKYPKLTRDVYKRTIVTLKITRRYGSH
jgi:hypothetical protein